MLLAEAGANLAAASGGEGACMALSATSIGLCCYAVRLVDCYIRIDAAGSIALEACSVLS
jgi:hypothetical protein